MLSYRHQGDYFEGDKVSSNMKAEILGCPTLDFCQRGHKVWLYSMGKKNDVTEEGMHEDATGDKL